MDAAGSVADWVTAVVAATALYFAWQANKESHRMLQLEQEREHKSDSRERAEQASDVSAWCIAFGKRRNASGRPLEGIHIHNASRHPVYEVTVCSTGRSGTPAKNLHLAVLPPGDFVVEPHPAYGWTLPEPVDQMNHPFRPVMNTADWAVQKVQLTDAFGISWMRDERGTLTELRPTD